MSTLTRNIIWFYNYDLYFSGISGCAYALVAPMFISEMSEPSIRGGLASVMQLMASVGVLFVGILNINGTVHWNYISAILIGVPGNVILNLSGRVISHKKLIFNKRAVHKGRHLFFEIFAPPLSPISLNRIYTPPSP